MKATKTLLATAFLSLFVAGQTAMAGEEAPRDEYSIGLVWSTGAPDARESMETNRVNYSIRSNTEEETSLDEQLFPDGEH